MLIWPVPCPFACLPDVARHLRIATGICADNLAQGALASAFECPSAIAQQLPRRRCDACLLADALDIPYGARVSPGAAGFLVGAAAHVSYAKAARLLARHGSRVRAATVMRCMRDVGSLCAEEDRSAVCGKQKVNKMACSV